MELDTFSLQGCSIALKPPNNRFISCRHFAVRMLMVETSVRKRIHFVKTRDGFTTLTSSAPYPGYVLSNERKDLRLQRSLNATGFRLLWAVPVFRKTDFFLLF